MQCIFASVIQFLHSVSTLFLFLKNELKKKKKRKIGKRIGIDYCFGRYILLEFG